MTRQKSQIQIERERTADHRFYLFTKLTGKPQTYQHTVCDRGCRPSSLAKFKSARDADLFLRARREHYIRTGE